MVEACESYGAKELHRRLAAIVLYKVVEELGHSHTPLSVKDWHNAETHGERAVDQH